MHGRLGREHRHDPQPAIGAAERERLEQHLAGCSACLKRVQRLRVDTTITETGAPLQRAVNQTIPEAVRQLMRRFISGSSKKKQPSPPDSPKTVPSDSGSAPQDRPWNSSRSRNAPEPQCPASRWGKSCIAAGG